MNKNPLSYAAKAAYVAGALFSAMPAKADINADQQYISQFLSAIEAARGEKTGPTRMTLPSNGKHATMEVTLMSTPGKNTPTDEKALTIAIIGPSTEINTQCFYNTPPRMGDFEVIPKSAEANVNCYDRMDSVVESITGALKQYASKTGTLLQKENIDRIAQGAAYDGNPTITPEGAELNRKIMKDLVEIIEGKK